VWRNRDELLELGALATRLGAVDGVDVNQRRVTLAAPWLPGRAGDRVALLKLAAADLGGRDVDVALGIGVVEAQDARASARQAIALC